MQYVIGDIHGCGDELELLINKILEKDDQATFISAGDCFDRAFGAAKVWHLINRYRIACVMGNHERKMLKYLKGQRSFVPRHYHYAFDQLFFNEDREFRVGRDKFLNWLEELPLLIETENYIVAHGGVDPYNPSCENESYNIYGSPPDWIAKYNQNTWSDKIVIYGHRAFQKPHIDGKTIGIDTSCAHGNYLTAYCLETKEFTHQQALADHYSLMKKYLKEKIC